MDELHPQRRSGIPRWLRWSVLTVLHVLLLAVLSELIGIAIGQSDPVEAPPTTVWNGYAFDWPGTSFDWPSTSLEWPPASHGSATLGRVTAQVAKLVVAPASAPEPYRRRSFGAGWTDEDRDCHDTRAEVLMRDSAAPVTYRPNGCTVDRGQWTDPWNGVSSPLASTFQIDHTVPLANAWESGAWRWSDEQRRRFANDIGDPDALVALEAADNTAKSDHAPDAWRPVDQGSWCHYADAWSRIKLRWALGVTAAERDSLTAMAATCPP